MCGDASHRKHLLTTSRGLEALPSVAFPILPPLADAHRNSGASPVQPFLVGETEKRSPCPRMFGKCLATAAAERGPVERELAVGVRLPRCLDHPPVPLRTQIPLLI